MKEGIVKVLALVDGHATVIAGLTVEDDIDGDERTAKDGAADQQLAEGARLALDAGCGLLHVGSRGAAEEGIAGGGRDGGGRS